MGRAKRHARPRGIESGHVSLLFLEPLNLRVLHLDHILQSDQVFIKRLNLLELVSDMLIRVVKLGREHAELIAISAP